MVDSGFASIRNENCTIKVHFLLRYTYAAKNSSKVDSFTVGLFDIQWQNSFSFLELDI